MLYEGEEPEDYPEEMEQQHDSDYGGDDDEGFYEGGVGVEPSFSLNDPEDPHRSPRPSDFRSFEARPWGHRQPRAPQPRPAPAPSLWETVTGKRDQQKKRWYNNSSWTDYGRF